ncbi:hypothetical protein [Aureibacter tunicatorum]|uniref:Lipocalin-like domain-containing protein n=1 Tax=Aureibacter tunicatorum TaxID=866807 RepID=A0AAE3XSP5_9BACT|nr:hypothetical protein [Aureibacter tunicatorum]MDR6241775.1 hypothetical protein [Aureibacter tunicatorum]BDD07433.1 hypothetical protein AUTU_49160 [Aureibacter tunicatorum]
MGKYLMLPLIAVAISLVSCNDDNEESSFQSQNDFTQDILSQTVLEGSWQEKAKPDNIISFDESSFTMSLSSNSALDNIDEECVNISVKGNYHFDGSKLYLSGSYQKDAFSEDCVKGDVYSLQEFSYELVSDKELKITNSSLSPSTMTLVKN